MSGPKLQIWNSFCLRSFWFVPLFHLRRLLLKSHEVQVGDVDHVRAAHHRQHPVLHLSHQGADIQQLTQLGLLYNDRTTTRQGHVRLIRLHNAMWHLAKKLHLNKEIYTKTPSVEKQMTQNRPVETHNPCFSPGSWIQYCGVSKYFCLTATTILCTLWTGTKPVRASEFTLHLTLICVINGRSTVCSAGRWCDVSRFILEQF